jgi:hypothetical protein
MDKMTLLLLGLDSVQFYFDHFLYSGQFWTLLEDKFVGHRQMTLFSQKLQF